MTLQLTVLVENTAHPDSGFQAEEGLSFFIEHRQMRILFDTGLTGIFFSNALKMGIDLEGIDAVVLSHGHSDHTGGLEAFSASCVQTIDQRRPVLIGHPRLFWPKAKGGKSNGSPMTEVVAEERFCSRLSAEPVWITPDLVFLGEIPRRFAFEQSSPGGRTIQPPGGEPEPDILLDDSAVTYRSDQGLVVITGCSHAGICNITEYAREVCCERRVAGVIGGLHLLSSEPRRLQGTGEYLRSTGLSYLHACHCTSLAAKTSLARYFPLEEVRVGMRYSW